MAQEPIYITTSVGRYVQGDAFTGSDKDHQGRPRLDQKGQPKTQWYIGVAFAKNDPEFLNNVWPQIQGVAQRDFPGGEWQRQDFAWKLIDGDQPRPDGKPRPAHEQGHYVLRLSSGFAPQVFNEQNQQIADPAQCKRGDFVQIYLSCVGNDDRQKPGVYVNPLMIKRVGYGDAINVGPSADQAFGSGPVALPPGASATPVAPAGGMPAMPGANPGGGYQPGGQGNPPVTGAGAPMQPGAPAPSPAAPAGFNPHPGAPAAPAGVPGQPTASPSNPVQPHYPILNGPTR
jgi:hypothetical protein